MRKFKVGLSVILVVTLVMTLFLPIGYAKDNDIKVMLNGEYIDFDVKPQMINDRTMVPFRAIFEAMGAKVEWNNELRQAIGEKDGKKVSMIIDSNEIVISKNGKEETIQIDQPPVIVDGRTLVPTRFVAQAFDKIVAWDDSEKTVIIFDLQYFIDKLKDKAPNFYEYITSANVVPETFEASDYLELSYTIRDTRLNEKGYATITGELETVVNENDAYFGLETEISAYNLELDKKNASKEKLNVELDAYIKDNKILIKTNLLDLMDSDKFEYNNKSYSVKKDGIVIELNQLGFDNISSISDLIMYLRSNGGIDEISKSINNKFYEEELTVKEVKDMLAIYDMIVQLVSNENFVKKNMSKQTMYTWTVDKKDIANFLRAMYNNGMIKTIDITDEDLQILKQVFKDFKMVAKLYVKDNIPTKTILDFGMELSDDNKEVDLELYFRENLSDLKGKEEKIKHPNYDKGLDIVNYMLEQEANYDQLMQEYEIYLLQEAVTTYISAEIEKDNTKSVKQVVSQIYNKNGWNIKASDVLNLQEEINLSKYMVTNEGNIEVKE